MLPTPTPEQYDILDAALTTEHCILMEADAGAAKSTSLEMVAHAIGPQPSSERSGPGFLALAFNVKIKKALERRLPAHAKVMTLNGLGHLAWLRVLRGREVTLDDRKLTRLVTATSKALGVPLPDDSWLNVRDTVVAAMLAGLVPKSYPQKGLVPDTDEIWSDLWPVGVPVDSMIDLCRKILELSVDEAFRGTISFDDQLYMPTIYGGVFPQYDLILGDELQDFSQLNILQVKKCRPKRFIGAGDRKQSCYAFRGADHLAMDRIKTILPQAHWLELPLHQTFRCPRAVVARQQRHAPGYTAAPENLDGEIISWLPPPNAPQEIYEGPTWTIDDLRPFLAEGIFILCRNNAPLLSLAMRLIRERIAPTMLGRDIGKGLIALSKKILPDDTLESHLCKIQIRQYLSGETSKLHEAEQDAKIAGLEDRAECLLAVMDFSDTAGELRCNLSEIFDNEDSHITLGSIHRAKGLESPNVLHLDPWRIPSRYAKAAAHRGDHTQLNQEHNLQYICETRTSNRLILANLKNLETPE